MPPNRFSPVLSALITVSKVLFIYVCDFKRKESSQERPRPLYLEVVSSYHEVALLSYEGSVYPMNRMLRLRILARTIAQQMAPPGTVSWDRDKILVG